MKALAQHLWQTACPWEVPAGQILLIRTRVAPDAPFDTGAVFKQYQAVLKFDESPPNSSKVGHRRAFPSNA